MMTAYERADVVPIRLADGRVHFYGSDAARLVLGRRGARALGANERVPLRDADGIVRLYSHETAWDLLQGGRFKTDVIREAPKVAPKAKVKARAKVTTATATVAT